MKTCQRDSKTCQHDLKTCERDARTCGDDVKTCRHDLKSCGHVFKTCRQDVFVAVLIVGLALFSVGIFLVRNWWMLTVLTIAIIMVTFMFNRTRQALMRCLKLLRRNFWFVLFVWLCNVGFSGMAEATLLAIRLFLVILVVFDVTSRIRPQRFARGMGVLLRPFAIFGLDVDAAVLAITVALNLLPVLSREAANTNRALKLKGVSGWRDLWRRPQIYVQCYFAGSFRRMAEMERALLLKGYGE